MAKSRILGMRITPKGAKSYVLVYRAAGRKRLTTLARCTEVSLKAARERAGAEQAAIRAGESDPLERQPALWIHGHMHDPVDVVLGQTRVLCNPAGYRAYGNEQRGYAPQLCVEIGLDG